MPLNKSIAIGIVIALSLNSAIMVVGFSYLQNEINQLKIEESDLPVTPTPQEPEREPEPQPEPKPTTPEPITPEPTDQESTETTEPEPTPQEPAEAEPTEPKPIMRTPEVNLTADDIYDTEPYDHLDLKIEGTIVNPNSVPTYNVSIILKIGFVEGRNALIIAIFDEYRIINIGTMSGNEVVAINESFEFRPSYWSSNMFTGLSYTVNWNETE